MILLTSTWTFFTLKNCSLLGFPIDEYIFMDSLEYSVNKWAVMLKFQTDELFIISCESPWPMQCRLVLYLLEYNYRKTITSPQNFIDVEGSNRSLNKLDYCVSSHVTDISVFLLSRFRPQNFPQWFIKYLYSWRVGQFF